MTVKPGWQMLALLTEELNGQEPDIKAVLTTRQEAEAHALIKCLVSTLASAMEAGYDGKEEALRVVQRGALEAAAREEP